MVVMILYYIVLDSDGIGNIVFDDMIGTSDSLTVFGDTLDIVLFIVFNGVSWLPFLGLVKGFSRTPYLLDILFKLSGWKGLL